MGLTASFLIAFFSPPQRLNLVRIISAQVKTTKKGHLAISYICLILKNQDLAPIPLWFQVWFAMPDVNGLSADLESSCIRSSVCTTSCHSSTANLEEVYIRKKLGITYRKLLFSETVPEVWSSMNVVQSCNSLYWEDVFKLRS